MWFCVVVCLYSTSRHVKRTGDIKSFVITEESGIAKGIRRIIAVTAHEANDATREANELSSRLDHIDKLSGKEKDAQLKTYTVVCVLGVCPIVPYAKGVFSYRILVRQTSLCYGKRNFGTNWGQYAKHSTSN